MGTFIWVLIAVLIIVGLPMFAYIYVRRNDAALRQIPPRALAFSPNRCSVKDVQAQANDLQFHPVSLIEQLPPETGRRYIVVGGVSPYVPSDAEVNLNQVGLIGGWIVIHLLQRGEDPRRIRVIDIRAPTRQDLTTLAKGVQFMQVDITDASALERLFNAPWPSAGSDDPEPQITVFHTAANIRLHERHSSTLSLSYNVNVGGTNNVINATQSIGATILIFTSTGGISVHNPRLWLWPWEAEPKSFVQIINDDDTLIPKHHTSNYATTKAQAEKRVRYADRFPSGKGVLRTGCIRPYAVFGPGGDMFVSVYLRKKVNPTYSTSTIRSWTFVENCSLAHLLYEQRLIELSGGTSNPDIGGQAFCVTDPGPLTTRGDVYTTLTTLTDDELSFPLMSPTLMLFVSHILEVYYLMRHLLLASCPSVASVGSWLPAGSYITSLQPAIFAATVIHVICDDSRARLTPQQGGLGYKGAWTTLEGLHKTVRECKSWTAVNVG